MNERIYIDVDGTLRDGRGLFPTAKAFILRAVQAFDCYWLTTHCHGSIEGVLAYLRPIVDDETFQALQQIKPTNWDVFKTEALSPTEPWTWLDDAPLATELQWLKDNGREADWIKVDTKADSQALADLADSLLWTV